MPFSNEMIGTFCTATWKLFLKPQKCALSFFHETKIRLPYFAETFWSKLKTLCNWKYLTRVTKCFYNLQHQLKNCEKAGKYGKYFLTKIHLIQIWNAKIFIQCIHSYLSLRSNAKEWIKWLQWLQWILMSNVFICAFVLFITRTVSNVSSFDWLYA